MKQVEVSTRQKDARDITAEETLKEYGADEVKVTDVYYLDSSIKVEELKEVAEKLLADRLTQDYEVRQKKEKDKWVIEVRYKDAVTDPAEDSIRRAVENLGRKTKHARTAKRYYITGNVSEKEIDLMCRKALANGIVEDYYYGFEKLDAVSPKIMEGKARKEIAEVKILGISDEKLIKVSREGMLSLSLVEMKAVQEHFTKLGRNPTDGEIETIAQTWSEHCKHKTFNSKIELDNNGRKEIIGNLFKETIVAATNTIAPKKDWLVSVFKDNAGIIKLDSKLNFAFKVETHNHPSALDPYGGASTGIGGVIRDVLGAGLGAKPIFNTDIFCFAPQDYKGEIPEGIIHPKRMFYGVVAGVRDYGNRMGIPTVNGAIVYHDDYLGAPLVYCGTGGILPAGMENKKASAGEIIVAVGGKTGRDGLHGATFSSAILDEKSSSSAVQIGNPIEEKKMMDALLRCRDERLYTCITDCGAGGFSSAVGEMAEETGAEVWLEKVQLKHAGMMPWEIWMSESQERMVIAVPKENLERVMKICGSEDVAATAIGKFTDTKKLVVKYEDQILAELDMEFLHKGLPKTERKARVKEKKLEEPDIEEKGSYNEELKKLLAHPTIASKEEVIRRYDFEVQGNTTGKPLVGARNDGPSDAAIIRPEFGKKAIVIANGINPRYSAISSYDMAASAIDEALRNIVASGGDIATTALLDNFCWGNVAEEEKLGSLVMAAKACHDIAVAFETPFISGKDSLHNEYKAGTRTIAIPDTLLISAVSVINEDDAVTMDIKEEGNSVYIIGKTNDELGGSHFYGINGSTGRNAPKVNAKEARESMEALTKAMRAKLVRSCHDLSEGGMAVAAAEMAFAGGIGMEIDAGKMQGSAHKGYQLLFSESNSRFLAEIRKKDEKEFEKTAKGAVKIGETTRDRKLMIRFKGSSIIDAGLEELREAWKGTIKW